MVISQSSSSPTGYPQQGYGSYQQQGYVMYPQQPQAQYPTDHQYYSYYTNPHAPQMAPNPCISTIPPPPRPPPPPQQHSNHHMMVNGSSGHNQQQEAGWSDKFNKYEHGTPAGCGESQLCGGKVKPTPAYGGYGYEYEYSWGTQPYQTYGHKPAGQGYQNVYYSIKKVD